jgi:hypothetical protein
MPAEGALDFARAAREKLGEGSDPLAEKHRPGLPTFSERSEAYISAHKPGLKNAKPIEPWEIAMRDNAAPLAEVALRTGYTQFIIWELDQEFDRVEKLKGLCFRKAAERPIL